MTVTSALTDFRYWKWRVLIAFCVFYAFNYLGRFNFSLIQPAVMDDLGMTAAQTGFINSWMFWGFAFGDLVHGRLGERYGYRVIVLLGALGTAAFNVAASYGDTVLGIALPWGVVGFLNAATWAPAIGLLAQWWGRRERGRALGLVMFAAGVALLLVWVATPWVAAEWGWRAALRYPPLAIAVLGILFYFAARDRPSDVGLDDYEEHDEVSRDAEAATERSHTVGLAAYWHLMTNWRFFVACQVKGLDNVVRYGIVSWAPVYYAKVGGLDLKSMALATFAYPLGYLFAPLVGGFISDRIFHGNRSTVIAISSLLSAISVMGMAIAPADSIPVAVVLLAVVGFTANLSPMAALAVDLAGRQLAGTASGVFDAHGYVYGALQATFFGWIVITFDQGWLMVFSAMAFTRIIGLLAILRVRA